MNSEEFIYHGSSMRGVFRDGERLRVESIDWSEVAAGDVLVFIAGGKQIVHRVILKKNLAAVTMGDNNPEPDPGVLHEPEYFGLVTGAVQLNGKIRPIARGRAGMRKFVFNQLRMRCRLRLSCAAAALCGLAFWRIKTNSVENFGDRQVFYFHHIPVAFRKQDSPITYFKWYKRLFFKAVEIER